MRLALTIFAFLWLFPVTAHAVCGLPSEVQWAAPPPYDPAFLEKTYDCLLAGYDPAKHPDYRNDLVLPMEYAGVGELMKGDGGLPETEREHILNDFGFWLQKEGDTNYAVTVLHKAVQLNPQRALAWLNLGDEYVAALATSGSSACCTSILQSTDILSLSNQASAAYHRYVQLTPHPDAYVLAYLARHPYDPANEAVCRYVAEQANAGNLSSLFLPDGAAIHLPDSRETFYLYRVTKSPNPESFVAYTTPQQHPGVSLGTPIDFSPLDRRGDIENEYGQLWAIPYDGSIAVLRINYGYNEVSTDSIRVVLPGRHVVCDVDQTSTPFLKTEKYKKLCAVFHNGHYFQQPHIDDSPPGRHIILAAGQEGNYFLVATTRADLRNDGHMLDVAFFSYPRLPQNFLALPPDCHKSGVVLYDPKTKTAIKSDLNNKLMNLPPFCPESADTLIIWQGKTYIETGVPGNMVAPATGIYAIKGDDVIPVCFIGNYKTYSVD
jgi:hypothetical protein